MKNLGELIKYIRQFVLEPATKEVEADDLTVCFYEEEITFQVNEVYDGLIYTYDRKADQVRMSLPEDRGDQYVAGDEFKQAVNMMNVLMNNRKILRDMFEPEAKEAF